MLIRSKYKLLKKLHRKIFYELSSDEILEILESMEEEEEENIDKLEDIDKFIESLKAT